MAIVGTARVRCPACEVEQDCKLVQSINTHKDPSAKQGLLAGELNVLVCACGKRTQLAATVLFHDPDADYFCQVVPGGDDEEMTKAGEVLLALGGVGTHRLVPSLNALVEKVKLLDAGLQDWAIEMTKVLLLASVGAHAIDRVLLFETVDREQQLLHWVLFDEHGREPRSTASPLAAYERLAARTQGKPTREELRIDRAWATEQVRRMLDDAS